MMNPKDLVERVLQGESVESCISLCEAKSSYNVELKKVGEDKWTASIKIPEAHVDEKANGDSGWKALSNLASRMSKIGLLD